MELQLLGGQCCGLVILRLRVRAQVEHNDVKTWPNLWWEFAQSDEPMKGAAKDNTTHFQAVFEQMILRTLQIFGVGVAVSKRVDCSEQSKMMLKVFIGPGKPTISEMGTIKENIFIVRNHSDLKFSH